MVISINRWFRVGLLIVAMISVIGFPLKANAWCVLAPMSGADQPSGTVITMSAAPSPSAIRIPKDIAPGTELYRITAQNNQYSYYRTNCNYSQSASDYYAMGRFMGSEPAQSSFYSTLGTVYETSTTGVGLVILTGRNNVNVGDKSAYAGDCKNYSCNIYLIDSNITYVFIKTGEITAASLNLADAPKLESVVGGNNSPGDEIVVFRPTLSGEITFTQPTCTLAETSKTVNLGKHAASDFTTTTPTTAWVDASINLINCNYGGAQAYHYSIIRYSSGYMSTSPGTNTANALWQLTLVPANGASDIIDDANGIMAIATGTDSATGVGIQLSTTNTATPTPVKFEPQFMTGEMVTGTNATMKIPLWACYIKTGAVTGGKANGKVIYRVEYK